MPFHARTYRVLIASPSDLAEERQAASDAVNAWNALHAAAEGRVEGVPKSVGKDFVKADHGRKIGKLPKHVKRKAKRLAKSGMISDRQMKKFGGE